MSGAEKATNTFFRIQFKLGLVLPLQFLDQNYTADFNV